MKQKLFSIFCCLLLSASMVTQASMPVARQQHPMRGASRVEKAVATNLKIGSSEATRKVESTSTPVGLSQRHNVAPRRNGVPTGYYYHDGDNNSKTFTLDQMTMDLRARKAFVDAFVQHNARWDVYVGLCFFHPETPNNAIPSGNYIIDKTQNDWTMYAGEEWGTQSYGAWVDWGYGNPPDVYWQIFKTMTESTVWVVNPYNAEKPIFMLVVGYDTNKNSQAWYEFGTEPAFRTVIVNETPDANGNYIEGAIDVAPNNAPNDDSYWEGTTVTITPHPASGYTLSGFTGAGSEDITDNGDGTYSFIVGAKNYNISATWSVLAAGAITGLASPTEGGSVTVSPSGPQSAGTEVTLTPVANPGYVFTGWADGGNANPRTVIVSGNATYTANFALTHTITVTADPAAGGVVTGGGTYAEGATVPLTATPNFGYRFDHWSDGGAQNHNVTMGNANASYTATFVVKPTVVLNYTGSCNKYSGYFNVIPESSVTVDGHTYAFRFETNSVSWRTGDFSSSDIDFSNSYQYTYLKKDNANLSLNTSACTATITQVYGTSYRLTAVFEDTNGVEYDIQVDFVVPSQYDESSNKTITIANPPTKQLRQRSGSEVWDGSSVLRLTTQTGSGTSQSKQYTVYYDFELSSDLYNNGNHDSNTGYIPSGTYEIKNSGVPRVVPSNGNATQVGNQYLLEPSGASEIWATNSSTTTNLWLMVSGTVQVINPNRSTWPMYVYGVAKNTTGYTVTTKLFASDFPTIYSVSANAGGSVSATPQYPEAPVEGSNNLQYYNGTTNVTIDATPATGYTFSRWSDNGSGYTNAHRTGITMNKNYTASFIAKTYTATNNINGNGGSNGQYTATYNATTIAINTIPTRTGYTLEGLYQEAGCTHKIADASGNLQASTAYTDVNGKWKNDGNVTLYAKWTASSFHLAWDAGDGELVDNAVYSYAVEGDYPGGEELPDGAPNATREGYQLTGWYDAEHDLTWTDDDWTMPNHDVTYTAQWTANTHNVSWVTDGNALTGTYTNGTTAYGTTIVAPATPTKTATAQYTYTFNGWTPAVAATMPDNDVTYTATWTQAKVQYTLSWDFAGGTTATAEDNYTHGLIDWGTAITAPANPTKDGYTFNGWNTTPAATMPAANVTYTAQWISAAPPVVLLDNEPNTHYNTFKSTYDGAKGVVVTYERQFIAGRWSTLCLPFNVNKAMFSNLNFGSRIYEFSSSTLRVMPMTVSISTSPLPRALKPVRDI